jgi:replicative DNA helicase
MSNFQPIANIDAEQALLGSILGNYKLIDEVYGKIKTEYFYEPKNRILWEAFLELWGETRPIDILSTLEILKRQKFAVQISSENPIDNDYISLLYSKTGLINGVESAIKSIRDKYLLRTIVEVADQLKTSANAEIIQENPNQILDKAQEILYKASLEMVTKDFININDILKEAPERIANLIDDKREIRGLSSGFSDVDKVLGGFQSSDLVILAARPSMGKTAFALEIMRRIALNSQIGVAIFSLEMSKEQLVDRMLTTTSKVDAWKLKVGRLDNEDYTKISRAIGDISDSPMWIEDSGSLSILELRAKARRLKSKHNIGLIIIDYLQLMSGDSRKYQNNRVQEVSDISRGLKMLAKELEIPIIALSQLSRSLESRDDKRPVLSDLRESGSIEQDADIVMFVHREAMYKRDMAEKQKINEDFQKAFGLESGVEKTEIIIAKHRSGQTGMVNLAWVNRLASFENLDGAKVSRVRGE